MGKGIKENRVHSNSISVGVPGFEPGMTGPESVVLPLHHTPIPKHFCFADAKLLTFAEIQTIFPKKIKKNDFF